MPLNTNTITDRERMKSLSPRLKHRCVIQKAEQTVYESDNPGYYTASPPMQRTYIDLKTVWCFVLPKSSLMDFISADRSQQDFQRVTHEVWVRRESIRNLGAEFSSAFDAGFDTVKDLNPVKNDYFLFLKEGTAIKGRRFRVKETRWDERNHEYMMLRCQEVEEVGTGYAP